MQRSLRHKTIIRSLGRTKTSIDTLANLTGASSVTIRRDLADLEGQGLLRRVHGGAIGIDQRGRPMPYALRSAEDPDLKELMARTCAELVADNMSVVLDNGSSTVAVARALVDRPATIMCLSLHSAVALGSSLPTTIVVPGGPIAPDSLSATAAESARALADFRADIAILGACAASPAQGMTTTTWDDAQTKRAIVACATRTVLVVAGSKLQRTSSFRFADLDDLDDLVTTSDASPTALGDFRQSGVRVHVARLP